MPKRYFCTLFDRNYLVKGLTTIRSLAQHCPELHIYVLCMDVETRNILSEIGLPYVSCILLSDIETPELLEAKKDRGVAEYCWTLSPCVPSYVFEHNSHIDLLTYIDSDLLFYSSVEPIYEEMGDCSVAIIEHRFTDRLKDREVNGRFCVQWVSFRRNEEGMACLKRWKEQCIEWCYYRLEDGKMGDQKYLDEWPGMYPGCHIIEHLGAGVAPWNYCQYRFTETNVGIFVNDVPVIFYHFHQFQLLANGKFDRLSTFYTAEKQEPLAIYEAYEAALVKSLAEIRSHRPGFSGGLKSPSSVSRLRWFHNFVPHPAKQAIKSLIRYRI